MILSLLIASPARTLEVYAAASLREAFGVVGARFEAAHPGTRVRLTFAGSQTLAAQIGQGAPADVFASASPKNLAGLAFDPGSRRVFATNRLVVIGAASLRDLARARRIVLGASSVPVGGYADAAIASAGREWGAAWRQSVLAHVVSREADVKAVLAKVRLGEADAGIVYASDALGVRVRTTAIPAAFGPRIEYPVVVLRDAREPALGREFVALLRAKAGRAALAARGFGTP